MIRLPKGAFAVKRNDTIVKEDVSQAGLILGSAKKVIPNKGTIIYTSEELNQYQLCTVIFRESFAEVVEIEGQELLYFRDLDSSIYYIMLDDKRQE